MDSKGTKSQGDDTSRSKSRWMVTASGKTFAMVGDKCTHAEALEFARLIWPNCTVE